MGLTTNQPDIEIDIIDNDDKIEIENWASAYANPHIWIKALDSAIKTAEDFETLEYSEPIEVERLKYIKSAIEDNRGFKMQFFRNTNFEFFAFASEDVGWSSKISAFFQSRYANDLTEDQKKERWETLYNRLFLDVFSDRDSEDREAEMNGNFEIIFATQADIKRLYETYYKS